MSRKELPVVQAMYDQYGEDCGFIVASVEAEDTVSTVEALKQTLGLTTLPMGTGGLDAFLAKARDEDLSLNALKIKKDIAKAQAAA